MESIYQRANFYDKEFIYECYLMTIKKPMPYEKITRKKMLETIVSYYNEEDHLLYYLTYPEINLLKEIIEKKKIVLTDENREFLIRLSEKFIINFSYYDNEVIVYEEFYDAVKKMVQKIDTKEGNKFFNLQRICIGLCNAYGVLKEEEFFDCIEHYMNDISIEEIKSIIKKSNCYGEQIAILEITYDNVPVTLYTYYNLEEIAEFLDSYIDVLSLPKYEFTYEEIMDYASYGINYKNPSYQRLIKKLKECNRYFDEMYFSEICQNTVNLMLDSNTVKKYIYDHYPHYEHDSNRFFELMDLCDEVSDTMNTWAARGYPVSRMGELIGGMHIDSMKKMERAYRYKTGMDPEEDFNDFLDFVDTVTEEEIDEFLNCKDKSKLN